MRQTYESAVLQDNLICPLLWSKVELFCFFVFLLFILFVFIVLFDIFYVNVFEPLFFLQRQHKLIALGRALGHIMYSIYRESDSTGSKTIFS